MGNLSNGEKFGIVILGIVLAPFYLIKQGLEWIGILPKPNYDYVESKKEEENKND